MSFTRWFIYISFAGGLLALSLQPSGIANATTFLVVNPHEGSSQDTLQRDSASEKKFFSGAESSGKVESDKDVQPGGDRMGTNSKTIDQSRDQGGESQGSREKDPNYGSGGASDPLNLKNPGDSGAGTGAGSR
jgi:hypothetical protein